LPTIFGVEERRHHDHRGAVLVVVEHRDVELLLEPILDLEAARGGDVLEVDAAEGGGDEPHRVDDRLRVLGREADGERVHPGELLEQHRLALHHRHRRLGADVPEAEHRAAVGDHRDGVPFDRELERLGSVRRDLLAHARDAGRVRHGEVVAGLQRVLVVLLDLSPAVHREGPIHVVENPGATGGPDRAQDLLPMGLIASVDGELAHALALAAGSGNQVDAVKGAAGLGDGGSELPQRLLASIELDPNRHRELGADRRHRGHEGRESIGAGGMRRRCRLLTGMRHEVDKPDVIVAQIAGCQHGVVSTGSSRRPASTAAASPAGCTLGDCTEFIVASTRSVIHH
jgi:hypothetical protein